MSSHWSLRVCECTSNVLVPPRLGWLNPVVSLVLLGIAVRGFPPPPVVRVGVASACFGIGLAR